MAKISGNSLEIEEAADALKGVMEKDVKEIVLTISSYIMKLAGLGEDIEKNKVKAMENIKNGLAYKKFLELIKIQGGNINYLNNIPKAKYIMPVISEETGYVQNLNAEKCRYSFS